MEKIKKNAQKVICIAIAMMLLSAIGASFIQTNGGKVTMKELKVETDEGWAMTCYLFVPDSATEETPAPAIVTSHGAYNNKEMQDANYVELARRGYVVLTIDQQGHGDSDWPPSSLWSGIYQGALMLSRLPYVDVEHIGVTGHSMGAISCSYAMDLDNENETPLISAVVLNSADAMYTDGETGEYANLYGSRDVSMIACVYDEFFHTTTDEEGNTVTAPYFMDTPNAQSFLYFGKDPEGLKKRSDSIIYRDNVDGEECMRAIYRPAIIHPWSHFSRESTAYTIEFFEEALGAPNPLESSDQVWMFKEAFNFLGLIGFVIFIVSFTIFMVFTPHFEELRADEIAQPLIVDRKGKVWFWISMAVAVLISMGVYLPIMTRTVETGKPGITAPSPFGVGCWSLVCGCVLILVMVVYYSYYGKKIGVNLEERGVKMPIKKLVKSIVLALIVVAAAYSCVFIVHYLFQTDFRIWTLSVKTFGSDKIAIVLTYLPLFLVYYVASSVSANSFNYNTVGKKGWANNLIVSLMAASPAIILAVMQYGTYFITGSMRWTDNSAPMYMLWMIQMAVILFGTTFISRFIYKVTRNPYIIGIINAILVVLISVANTRYYIW